MTSFSEKVERCQQEIDEVKQMYEELFHQDAMPMDLEETQQADMAAKQHLKQVRKFKYNDMQERLLFLQSCQRWQSAGEVDTEMSKQKRMRAKAAVSDVKRDLLAERDKQAQLRKEIEEKKMELLRKQDECQRSLDDFQQRREELPEFDREGSAARHQHLSSQLAHEGQLADQEIPQTLAVIAKEVDYFQRSLEFVRQKYPLRPNAGLAEKLAREIQEEWHLERKLQKRTNLEDELGLLKLSMDRPSSDVATVVLGDGRGPDKAYRTIEIEYGEHGDLKRAEPNGMLGGCWEDATQAVEADDVGPLLTKVAYQVCLPPEPANGGA